MGSRGSRRRTRTTVLTAANSLLIVVCLAVSIALFAQNAWILRAAAVAAVLVAIGASLLIRHQLLVERLAHSDERAQVAQEYSRITSARVVENDAALVEKLFDAGYKARPERAILFTIDAWDVNCSQHIVTRFTEAEIAEAMGGVTRKIAELEAENARLRALLAERSKTS